MGPIALFDKSFIQSLSVDESVWFDHFFIPNICPIFYIETLADLAKISKSGRNADDVVARIAEKTPITSGMPCSHHSSMAINNLFGHNIPFTGQIPISGGRPVSSGSKKGIVFDEPPEAKAFNRWQNGEFQHVEKEFAAEWRQRLNSLDLKAIATIFQKLGINGKSCKTLKEAKDLADQLIQNNAKPFDVMKLAVDVLGVHPSEHQNLIKRWSLSGNPPLNIYAPYAAHVLCVELFFQIALAADLISTERASNRIDNAYLYYLPFCNIFISNDLLHQKCAPLFCRSDQDFVWGPSLKNELKIVNSHFLTMNEETKENGIPAFAHIPPGGDESLLIQLWNRHLAANWRKLLDTDRVYPPLPNPKLVKELNDFNNAPTLEPSQIDFDMQNSDAISIQRLVKKRKGSWWLLPKNLEVDTKD